MSFDSVSLWRIAPDTGEFPANDLSGRAAEVYGGGWNRAGTRMVYAATSRALACLEAEATQGLQPLPLTHYLVEFVIPRKSWDRALQVPAELFLRGWPADAAQCIDWGTQWAARNVSLLARVPSRRVPEEENVLINPRHADLADVIATKVREWAYPHRSGSHT